MAKMVRWDCVANVYSTVKEAFNSAKEDADSGDLIYVGGINFIVAEVVWIFL